MKTLSKTFLTGMATLLPVAVTLYALWWLEDRTGKWVQEVFENAPTFTGFGIIAGMALIFVVGILMRTYVVRSAFRWGEGILARIPLVKTLYGSLRDLMGYFAKGDEENDGRQVVMVTLPGTGVRLLGLLTREDFSDLPEGIGAEDTVAVYLPMSYQLGGFTTMVPRYAVEPVDMSMEAAMRFAVTAGMSTGSEAG